MANVIPVTRQIELVQEAFSPEHLAELARQALVAEAELTPKPGLVDHRGSGSHDDLSLDLMRRSSSAIAPYFAAMAVAAKSIPLSHALRTEVAAIGRAAESAMFQVTGGSNSHKGAIWILGLLVTAVAQRIDSNPESIAQDAGFFASLPDRARPQLVSHGEMVRVRYGTTGARGEAFAGFPTWFMLVFPLYAQQEMTAAQKRIADCQRFSTSWLASKIPVYFIAEGLKGWQLCKKELPRFSSQAAPEVSPGNRLCSTSIANS